MNRERAPQTSKRSCARTGRHGFTLVEMMVVIIVIAILAGLLLPAIGGAVRRAKNARIALEIAAISQALERYKMEYGEYPPDFVPRTDSDGDLISNSTVLDQHLSRIFRYRALMDVPKRPNPIDPGQPPIPVDFIRLEPGEALYFWLRGFSNNPRFPVSGGPSELYREGTDHTSMFSFDKSRLTDVDEDGFVEYHPQGDGAERPYIYYRADVKSTRNSDGLAYDAARLWALAVQDRGNDVAAPYLSTHKVPKLASSPPNQAVEEINAYAAPKKFQIISAGLGGVFGKGGKMVIANDGTRTVIAGVYPEGPYPNDTHYEDRDNLTNFSEGKTLKDAQE